MKKKETIKMLITIFIVVMSEDTLIFGTNANPIFIVIRYLFYILFIALFFNKTWRHINRKAVLFTLVIIGVFFITMLINRDFRNGYFIQLLTIILAFKLANIIGFNEFMQSLLKVVYFLAFVSILLFLVISFFPIIVYKLPSISNYGDMEFATIIISNIMKGGDLLRNSSIFREPGVFGVYLIICLLYEFFFLDRLNLKHIIVFSLALITTFSTMAFIVFAIIITTYILRNRNMKAKLLVSVLVILFIIFFSQFLFENVFNKLDPDTYEYRSTLSRISSIMVPSAIFLDYPFGVGLSNFSNLYVSYSFKLFDIELKPDSEATNTIINTFAIYGFIYGVILLYSIYGLAKEYRKTFSSTIIIFLIYILLFSSQEFRFSLLFNILIVYGLMYKKRLNKNIRLNIERE